MVSLFSYHTARGCSSLAQGSILAESGPGRRLLAVGALVAAVAASACGESESGPGAAQSGGGAGSNSAPSTTEGAQSLERVGLQMYTLRAAFEEDYEGTLRQVAEMGYDEVEFSGLAGQEPAVIKALLDELNLTPVASHIDAGMLRRDPQAAVDETVALGASYLVLAYMTEGVRNTWDKWDVWIEVMNDVGQRCRDAGIQFVYHNHNWEFEPLDGELPFNRILAGIDRDLVQFEMDFYWLALANEEPQPWFEQYPGGYPLSHVKDMADTPEREMVDVGDGRLDFAGTFAQAPQSGMKHFFVEHDDTTAPFETARRSLEYLRQLKF